MTLTLSEARESRDICTALLNAIWKKDKPDGSPPPLTPYDLKPHEPVQIIHDHAGGFDINTIKDMYPVQVRQRFKVEGPIYRTPKLDQALEAAQDEIENICPIERTDATIAKIESQYPELWEKYNVLSVAKGFFTFGVFLIADFAERIEAIHQNWEIVRQVGVNMPHPLAPIVREWLIEQTAKPITREYDQRHPVSILRSGSLGSIRDVVLDMEGTGQSPVIISDSERPNESQLTLWKIENDSILAQYIAILPALGWQTRDKDKRRRGCAQRENSRRSIFSVREWGGKCPFQI